MRGLRIVSADGEVSSLISGTPKIRDDVFLLAADNLEFGTGWLLDVQAHPNYAQNGWLYLHYTECQQRCEAVGDEDNPPQSRNVLVRGRIKDGRWLDQELIWQAASFDASQYLDMVAGGRIAFDPDGYVFITVGMRSMDAIQDLRSPYGKIHRIHDDGRIPTDNPFLNQADAIKTIWTLGHRSPQGLFFDVPTRLLYETEHGPRGGDEINVLRPGKNYGWPLFSSGQNYDGTEVAHGRTVSELELQDTEQPVVDWVPSPAISNLTVYRGDAFPNWRGQMLVGSLKASNLYRLEAQNESQEIMVPNLARIRDIDVDRAGLVYLLLEHASGGQIVRLKPYVANAQ
jgi:glucose/arabinose dehydrogenase